MFLYRFIDVGGGASRLANELVRRGYRDITVLDVSQTALQAAQPRLGAQAAKVTWIAADATQWRPARTHDLWRDRAAFIFSPRLRTARAMSRD